MKKFNELRIAAGFQQEIKKITQATVVNINNAQCKPNRHKDKKSQKYCDFDGCDIKICDLCKQAATDGKFYCDCKKHKMTLKGGEANNSAAPAVSPRRTNANNDTAANSMQQT